MIYAFLLADRAQAIIVYVRLHADRAKAVIVGRLHHTLTAQHYLGSSVRKAFGLSARLGKFHSPYHYTVFCDCEISTIYRL